MGLPSSVTGRLARSIRSRFSFNRLLNALASTPCSGAERWKACTRCVVAALEETGVGSKTGCISTIPGKDGRGGELRAARPHGPRFASARRASGGEAHLWHLRRRVVDDPAKEGRSLTGRRGDIGAVTRVEFLCMCERRRPQRVSGRFNVIDFYTRLFRHYSSLRGTPTCLASNHA